MNIYSHKTSIHADFMALALEQAKIALSKNEIPVGAVVTMGKEIIASAHNLTVAHSNPVAHAEVLAMNEARAKLGVKYLNECSLYVTLEPCPMCSGAIILNRLSSVVFGCYDEKSGAAGTLFNITHNDLLNHQAVTLGGVLDSECAEILRIFFQRKRSSP